MKPIVYIFAVFIIAVIIFVVFTSTVDTPGWFSKCNKCQPGYYRGEQDDITTCIGCDAGSSTNGKKGQVSCTKCLENTYSSENSGICSDCAPGTTSAPGATSCIAGCEPGYTIDPTDANNCIECAGDTYSDTYNSTECTPCDTGTYITISDENEKRTSKKLCLVCPPGYEGKDDGPGCNKCQAGYYKDTYSKDERCKPCDVDTFNNSEGSSYCTTCSDGSSTCGNTAAQSCTLNDKC